MMQKILGVMLMGSLAFAGLKTGVYTGQQLNGGKCEFKVNKVYFLNNVAHPLNERVDIEVQGVAMTLQHPPIISSEKKMAYFNHDLFQGIIATQTGGLAMEIKLAHPSRVVRDEAVPTEFHLIQHQYQKDIRNSLICLRLQLARR